MKANSFLVYSALAIVGFIFLAKSGGPSVEEKRKALRDKYPNELHFINDVLPVLTAQEVGDVYHFMVTLNGDAAALSADLKARIQAIGVKYSIFD